jgi:hypothetical protein
VIDLISDTSKVIFSKKKKVIKICYFWSETLGHGALHRLCSAPT